MKKIAYIFSLLLFTACNSEDVNDCFQNAGTTIQQEVSVSDFEKILVNRDIELIIEEALDYRVVIETGEYLMNDVEAVVVNNELRLTDNNSCNFVRDYGITKVYVYAPNLTHIRNSSQYTVSSNGILNCASLQLFSEDFNAVGSFTVGDFRLGVSTTNLRITANNISSFYISGTTENLFVGFYSGAGRFEGTSLIAENVNIYHRGSNDMIVNPQQELTGDLFGTGDLISVNRPTTVSVQQHYTGRLIFE